MARPKSTYAQLANDGSVVLHTDTLYDDHVADPVTAQAAGKAYWVPWTPRGDQPAFDPETHHPPQAQRVINPLVSVVDSWISAAPKTPQEIDDELAAIVDRVDATRDLTKGLGLTLFDVLNMVRDLQGNPQVTLAQFKNYVKGKM